MTTTSRTRPTLALAIACVLAAPALAQPRRPVYVGSKACAECHDGPTMGDQASIWLGTKHARAYAALGTPEAREIAKISGVPIEPQKSPLCLGCHATGASAEESEKDPAFSIRDGVACERCHGPGSEHVDAHAGSPPHGGVFTKLDVAPLSDCMRCHREKPSHVNILKPKAEFDLAAAFRVIAHPTPKGGKPADLPPVEPPVAAGKPKWIGSAACAECHDAPEKGYAFCKWQASRHARAFATLGAPKGAKFALDHNEKGDPRRSVGYCLKCHATGFQPNLPGGGAEDTFSLLEGVGCEACHGPGSAHAEAALASKDKDAILASLVRPARETCTACHQAKTFDVETAFRTIAHPAVPPPEDKVVRYKTPITPALRPGGKELYVTCEAAATVCVVDTSTRRKVAEIGVGGQPMDVAFSPDGNRAYITNRLDDSLTVIDTDARKVVATVPVGDEPHGVRTDRSGGTIYVLNTSSDSISVIDAKTLKEEKRLATSRSPWALALSPDGGRFLVTNALSRFVPFGRRSPPRTCCKASPGIHRESSH
jgi:YVTN family beta-propeller protein